MDTAAFRNIGYEEAAIRELLGIKDVPLVVPEDIPGYLRRCERASSHLGLALELFLLRQKVRRAQLELFLPTASVDELLARGFLVAEEEWLAARVDLYPCLGAYLFTDPVLARKYEEGHVYQLGTDSYVLARVMPRKPGEKALDLCCGSGVHAILASRDHELAIGVDLSPRAIDHARFNARFNDVTERCRFVVGDLYAPVNGDGPFDAITANPPFVPTPDRSMAIHRRGGLDGEDVSRRLVAGLPEHLAEGGTFAMIVDYPVKRDSRYVDRLQAWLGRSQGWGIGLLEFGYHPLSTYIQNHIGYVADYYEVYDRYLAAYEALGIERVAFGAVFVRRLDPEHPGFVATRSMRHPNESIAASIEEWLVACADASDPRWRPAAGDRPMPAQWVNDLWTNRAGTRRFFEFAPGEWPGVTRSPCSADEAEFFSACDGRELGAIATSLASTWGIAMDAAERRVRAAYAALRKASIVHRGS